MKNNTFFKLFIILTIAFLFRIYMLDKPEGLWNDEYMGWYIASKSSILDFTKELMKNCHMPFYYIYLKIWIGLFGDADYILRLSSVVPSIISVIVMFFAGKELKDEKLGLMAALLTTISSFNIYFSQEMRLYSLLFLLSAIQLLYFIKLTKIPNKTNFLLFIFSNAMLFITHTLGVAFAGINFIIILYYFYKHNEKYHEIFKNFISLLKQISPILIGLMLLSPLIINIVLTPSLSQFWSYFNFSKILFLLTDYFSPIQLSIISPPNSFFKLIVINNKINLDFIIIAILPTIISIISIVNAIKQNKKPLNYALLSAGIFFLLVILFSISGRMILLTKYTTEIYPTLILALSLGLLTIKNTNYKKTFIFLFLFINLFYLLYAGDAVHKKTRLEGHKAPVKLLKASKLKNTDQIIFTFYDHSRFEKYMDENTQYNFSSIHKSNFMEIMFKIKTHDEYIDLIKHGKTTHREYFKQFPNNELIEYIKEKYTSNMKTGDRIALVYMKNISMYTNYNLQKIVNDDEKYKKNNFIFLSFSHLINHILYVFDRELKLESMTKAGDWFFVVYVKTE